MDRLYKKWKRTHPKVRKPFVFVLGFTIVGAGIAMLLLPGPGWGAIFLGFAILASEFAFAERVRDRLIHFLKVIISRGERAWRRVLRRHSR